MAASTDSGRRKKVAIVGSGAAGIAALWALNRTHHDVYLYEAADRPGGQTNTVEWKAGNHRTLVDTGFVVMDSATYPNFLNFLQKAHVKTVPTNVTFGVSRDGGRFEWAGLNWNTIFCQRRNLLSPRMWRMAFEIIRFKQFARDVLTSGNIDSRSGGRDSTRRKGSNEETIRQYLEREGYSDTFRDNYIIPMAASIWTIRPDGRALAFPAVDFIRRLWDIGLLSPRSSGAEWLTIRDGSRAYIDAVMRGFPSNHRFLRTAVRAVVDNDDGRVRLHLDGGSSPIYDHVILAVPGDEAYALVEGSATPEEKQILSQFRTSTRTAVLHGDVSLMPRSRKAWSSWTCTTQSYPGSNTGEPALVSMTYNMNLLLQIPTEVFGNVLLTLDPLHEPNPRTVQGRYNYRQGVDDANTIRAQQRLGRIQNTRGISYAGAWTSNGSLEDGFSSGLRVAQEHLGARLPFRLSEPGSGPDDRVGLGVADLALRLVALIIQVFVFEMFDRVVGSYRAGKTSRRPHVNGLSASIKKKAF